MGTYKARATFASSDMAAYMADTVAARGHRRPAIRGRTVTFTAGNMAWLGTLPFDADGHFDGEDIWVQGAGYRVSGPAYRYGDLYVAHSFEFDGELVEDIQAIREGAKRDGWSY